ncbi:hypothetical protein D9611_003155 [Ephemerocybe angulata]|uniref:BRCT domain-containing protein n=1 Tax=Ephemerocybe angulata TaxID=980116 RepID=A0A8H5FGZ8_9AGAR|nr:hypothetical protein D9611_003155 [Tulosesus angulatus]
MDQPTTQAEAKQIFVTSQGRSVSVFTQAEDIIGRPRIAKQLKRGGATITRDPKDADIILVNEDSDAGKTFIRVWSNDGGKVVLRYQWVTACVAAEKMLKEADNNWGGHMTHDDGTAINDEDELSDTEQKSALRPTLSLLGYANTVARSPLPTPRPSKSPANPTSSATRPRVPVPAIDASASNAATHAGLQLDANGSTSQDPEAQARLIAAIGDIYARDPSAEAQAYASKFQNIPPKLFTLEDVQMASPLIEPSVSAKVRGKQRDVSVTSRATSRDSANSQPPPSPVKSVASPAPPGQLFITKKGEPLKFFVQVGHIKRVDLVNSIKKNGGRIEANLADADYAILYSNAVTKPRDYQSLLTSAMSSGVPAVNGRFVADSIKAGKLLKCKEYKFAPLEKRRRQSSVPSPSDSEDEPLSQVVAKKAKTAASHSPTIPTKPAKAAKPKPAASTSKATAKPASKPPSGTKKVSPDAVPMAHPHASGRVAFRYTEDEMTTAMEEAYKLYCSDENASSTMLATLLHKKYPHHTMRSWVTQISQVKRSEFEDARKRGSIQCRKRKWKEQEQATASRAASTPSVGDASRPSSLVPQPTPPPPLPVRQAPKVPTTEEDLETFANFLAFEGGDRYDQGDSIGPYAALSNLAPWRSAQNWLEFWTQHSEQITALYLPKAEEADQRERERREKEETMVAELDISLGDKARNY